MTGGADKRTDEVRLASLLRGRETPLPRLLRRAPTLAPEEAPAIQPPRIAPSPTPASISSTSTSTEPPPPARVRLAPWAPLTPQMADPYPPRFSAITFLRQESDLMIARPRVRLRPNEDRELEYVLARDFTVLFDVDGREWRVTAPAGMLTDLATARWFTKPILGRVGPHLEAAIIHDYLCIAWQDLTGPAHRPLPRPGDFEFSNAAMIAMLQGVGLHSVVLWGVEKVIGSDVGRERFRTHNPAPRYVNVPRGGDWPD